MAADAAADTVPVIKEGIMPGYLVISRPNAWSGRAVGHRIRINGQPAGTVRNNNYTGFTLPPGRYQVRTTTGGSRSQELSVTVAENTQTVLLSEPNQAVTVVSMIVGGAVGIGAVAAHGAFGVLAAVIVLVSAGSLAVGRFLPGTFVRLRVASSGPVMPWPTQGPPAGPMGYSGPIGYPGPIGYGCGLD